MRGSSGEGERRSLLVCRWCVGLVWYADLIVAGLTKMTLQAERLRRLIDEKNRLHFEIRGEGDTQLKHLK